MEREILYRLMRKLEDGTYVIVGWEKHLMGGDGLIAICHRRDEEDDPWFNVDCLQIHHQRKDQYTGISIGERKLFERDEVETYRGEKGVIEYSDYFAGFQVLIDTVQHCFSYRDLDKYKITGILGVTPAPLSTNPQGE